MKSVPFGFGMDVVNKQTCLELLKTTGIDKNILLVDHATELNSAVDSEILVTKTTSGSVISVV